MKVGYVRVSSRDQNTVRQDVLMQQLSVDCVYTDRLSGKNTDRPELNKLMDFVRQGDTVIVESISRFARNTKDLLELIEKLETKKVQFISQKEALDTSTPAGRFMLIMFGAIAELERKYIRQRQREGIDIAMAEGRFTGRPKKSVDAFYGVYVDWKNKKITATRASELLGIVRSTFYRRIKEFESDQLVDF
jgi:DNA invertase Pin-like site-specific DNA recombinase